MRIRRLLQQIGAQGFALPTVLISSVVMLTVLSVTVTASASIRTSLKSQYYSQLAKAAGDAGVAYAEACLAANGNIPTWSNANPLTPATDCSGSVVGGNPTTVSTNGDIVSSFSVGMPTTDASGRAVTIPNSGFVQLLRTSTGAVWKTYNQPTAQPAVVPDLCSGSATSSLGWTNAIASASAAGYTLTGSGAQTIEPLSGGIYPGSVYLRKDFSVTKAGTYQLSMKAAASFTATIDGNQVLTGPAGSGSTSTVSTSLSVGCHSLVVTLSSGTLDITQIRLVAAVRQAGSSNDVVTTDTSWRVATGTTVSFSDYRYSMSSSWSVARDLNAATTSSASWAAGASESTARFISTTHSYSGANYPAAQYAYFRDYRDVVVTSSTTAKLTVLCDDRCDVFMDGDTNPILSATWSNVTSQTINLPQGSHRFAVRLYNTALGSSGFALALVRTSDGVVMTTSNARWQAATIWTGSANMYYSYDKTFWPNPSGIKSVNGSILVVGGGGGGGRNGGGGGGGGGVQEVTNYRLIQGTYTVTVGGGGAVASVNTAPGSNGGDSQFDTLLSVGGGGGASRDDGSGGVTGGSGGGGAGAGATGTGASTRHLGTIGVFGQGNSSGNGTASDLGTAAAGGGGGGAGGAGTNAASNVSGNGGSAYTSSISGTSLGYGGGGGGGPTSTGTYGTAGSGAGASGASGTANRGGGGSGGGIGGSGGSGVVIISYPSGSMVATGGTITTSGGNTIHTFTTSGTFTITSIN